MGWFTRALRAGRPPAIATDDPVAETRRLGAALAELVRTINLSAGRLPPAAVVDARWITDDLAAVLATTAVRPLDPYTAHTVESTVVDYLPTTLQAYLAVDPVLRDAPHPSGDTPARSLERQLDALATSTAAILVATREQDADALLTHGRFLATRFTGSDLDR